MFRPNQLFNAHFNHTFDILGHHLASLCFEAFINFFRHEKRHLAFFHVNRANRIDLHVQNAVLIFDGNGQVAEERSDY